MYFMTFSLKMGLNEDEAENKRSSLQWISFRFNVLDFCVPATEEKITLQDLIMFFWLNHWCVQLDNSALMQTN